MHATGTWFRSPNCRNFHLVFGHGVQNLGVISEFAPVPLDYGFDHSKFASILYSRIQNIEYYIPMALKPQDLMAALKLVALKGQDWSYAWLAVQLDMSPSQLHAAIKRALAAQLLVEIDGDIHPNRRNLMEFLEHGVKYVFLPKRGELTRGMPTAWAAEPLASQVIEQEEPPPVWPSEEGNVRGMAFSPLYPQVPAAAAKDPLFYELLALVDAIRGGRARERALATKELRVRLEHNA